MTDILLTSASFVKEVSSISDNIAGKYLLPSMREAQEQGLKGILGDALLAKCKTLVKEHKIDHADNAAYKELVDRCQYYLAYQSIVELIGKVNYKVTNFGVAKTTDENIQAATQDEVFKQQYYYQSKADACCLDIQNFILENRADYPEVNDRHCHKIKSNLMSSASCGIFLGGARGKRRSKV